MACTPRRLVHWAAEDDINEFAMGSPYSDASSSDSINATSTLQYVNSELVAHGFARPPGLSLEGISKEDGERAVKCLLTMISQRMEDMQRSEQLSTKLRTMSYEHERLASMHRDTEERLCAAERETNLFKSRLSSANKSLQTSEAAHKVTSAELQRARSSLHSVRQTQAAELKRREKEMEKMTERWTKISDAQSKLGATAAGLRISGTFANAVVSRRQSEIIGREGELLEDALEEAEKVRKELIEENTNLKNVVLSAANELARIISGNRTEDGEEAQFFTMEDIFSLSARGRPTENFRSLLTSLQDRLEHRDGVSDSESTTPLGPLPGVAPQTVRPSEPESQNDISKEVLRLQNTIIDLRRQLDQAQTQRQSGTYADQAQAIVRRFVEENADEPGPAQGFKVDDKGVLEKLRKELDKARMKLDEAALSLRDEKESLEEERRAFLREKRLWKSQMGILHDDDTAPAPPNSGLGAYFDAPVEPLALPLSPTRPLRRTKKNKSPRKTSTKASGSRSPAKPAFAVGKVGMSNKKGRGSLSKKPPGVLLGASMSKPKVIPPMETEVIPSTLTIPSKLAGKGSLIVPTAFVLPPPSPLTTLPPQQDLLSSLKPMAAPTFAGNNGNAEASSSKLVGNEPPSQHSLSRPFPVAKPLAQHMIHAYSPARPSPLSRILMLARSPAEQPQEEIVEIEANSQIENDDNSTPSESDQQHNVPPESVGYTMSLEEELGLEESASDESPLREKNIRLASKGKGGKGRSRDANSLPGFGERSKAKGRSTKAALEKEKENTTTAAKKSQGNTQTTAPLPLQKVTTVVKPLGAGKGGARRVPIGSADAAHIGPGWK